MSYGSTREQAPALLKQHVKNENMIRHCLGSLAGPPGADELEL